MEEPPGLGNRQQGPPQASTPPPGTSALRLGNENEVLPSDTSTHDGVSCRYYLNFADYLHAASFSAGNAETIRQLLRNSAPQTQATPTAREK